MHINEVANHMFIEESKNWFHPFTKKKQSLIVEISKEKPWAP